MSKIRPCAYTYTHEVQHVPAKPPKCAIVNIQWNIQDRNFRPPPPECRTFQTSALRRVYGPPDIGGDSRSPPTDRAHFRSSHGHTREIRKTQCWRPPSGKMPDIRRASAGKLQIHPDLVAARSATTEQLTFRLPPKCLFWHFLSY